MRDIITAATGLFILPDIPESPSPGMAHRADADCQGWRTQCHTHSGLTITFRLRAQAYARQPAAGEACGFSLRDAHGGS